MIIEYDMQQQMMMQQAMMMQQQMNNESQIEKINITFKNIRGMSTVIIAKYGTQVKDVLKQYIEKNYGFQNDKKLIFVHDAKRINENEVKAVEDFFNIHPHPTITVNEI